MNRLGKICFTSLVLLGAAIAQISYASTHVERTKDVRNKLESMEIEETVTLNGEKKKLYREYKNPHEALQFIKKSYPESLQRLQKQYYETIKKENKIPSVLMSLSQRNWEEYGNVASAYHTGGCMEGQKLCDGVTMISMFFDIYENTEDNQRIRNRVADNRKNQIFSGQRTVVKRYRKSKKSYYILIKNLYKGRGRVLGGISMLR